MSDNIIRAASEVWKSELDAINEEASSLLAAARQLSIEERRALLEANEIVSAITAGSDKSRFCAVDDM